jgi:hypothetical protein
MTITRALMLAWCLLASVWPATAAPLPAWAREVLTAGSSTEKAPAIILLDQVDITITPDGRMRTVRRYAVQIRDRSGTDAAVLRAVYIPGSGSVKQQRGWIAREVSARDLTDDAIVDAALVNNDVYNDVRVRAISGRSAVTVGDTFVAELETDEALLFSQFDWGFQATWPAVTLRRVLNLPPGWRMTAQTFNGSVPEPRVQANSYVWERTAVDAIPDEPAMPPYSDVVPRVAISMFGPDPARVPGQFSSWQDVARWLNALGDTASASTPALASKAAELTKNAQSPYEKAAAIARYVQRIQYISIQTGLGRGGGYQPRRASLVFERGYGDCKDKVALMRALLSTVGISSSLVSLYSGDREYVRDGWPSPQQFNHAIIAIQMPAGPDRPLPVVQHPALGPLLFFDPTDEFTPFGELPLDEQGSLALVVNPSTGSLTRLPSVKADTHRIERIVTGVLLDSGNLTATVRERYSGHMATIARARRGSLTPDEYRDVLTSRLSAGIPRVKVSSVTLPTDTVDDEDVSLAVEAPGFAQKAGTLVLVPLPFNSAILPQLPASASRKTGVVLEPRVAVDSITFRLPVGLSLDGGPPPAVSFESPFGRYQLEVALRDGMLQATRRLEISMQRVAPAQVQEARTFFERVRRADSDVVVLTPKP